MEINETNQASLRFCIFLITDLTWSKKILQNRSRKISYSNTLLCHNFQGPESHLQDLLSRKSGGD